MEWHWKAALNYYSPSVLELSWLLEYGEERRRDKSKALELLRLAAKLNNETAQYLLGLKHATGDGVPRDLATANEYYGRAAASGEARAQNNLGAQLVDGLGTTKYVIKGIEWIRKSALQGNSVAMVTLGFFHETGFGLPKNLELAVEWYRRAADSGDARGQKYLGFMLASGLGASKDVARAIEWYQKAVDNGYSDAAPALANLYIRMGGDASAAQAARWLRRGVTLGNAEAMNNLAAFIDVGSIVALGEESAVSLYERATEMRNASAMTSMGIRYIHGRDVIRDVPRGVLLLEDAAATGNTFAKTMLAAVLATAPEGVMGNVRRAIVLAIEASQFDDFAAVLAGQIAVGAPSQITQAEIDILRPRLQRVARSSTASNATMAKLVLGAVSRLPQWNTLDIDLIRADLHELSELGNDDASFGLIALYLEKSAHLVKSTRGIELLQKLSSGSSKYAAPARILERLLSEGGKNYATVEEFLQSLVPEIVSGNTFAAILVAIAAVSKEPEAAAAVFRALIAKGDPIARAQLCKLIQDYKVLPSGSAEMRLCLSVP